MSPFGFVPFSQCSVTAIVEHALSSGGGYALGGMNAGANAGTWSTEETYEFVVHVKYVRRELRKLSDRDREAFFNAVSVMQRVPSAVGRLLYGDKYYSKDYMNRLHMYYGELEADLRMWERFVAALTRGKRARQSALWKA